jgi:DtxR family transcriptional regulator, Mn-dependent transcriptional regulator
MANQITLSASEEMYLVTIRKICEDCTDTPIPIPEIAAGLDVQPVSVNQMVKKLAEMGLVNYTPYKGVELTTEGRTISNRILRHRRLWEVFLVRDLQMEVEAADALACHLEHITAVDVGDRLSAFLDHPSVCYHGDPIPQIEEASQEPFAGQPLTDLQAGEGGTLIRIDADGPAADFLAGEGFRPGARLTVLGVGSRGEVLAESPQGRVQLSEGLAAQIRVGKSVP